MKITRREDQQGTHRMSMSLSQTAYTALRNQSAKEKGYSIAGVARRLVDRALAAGLLYAETPSSKVEDLVKMYQSESVVQVYEELLLVMQENIDLLLKKDALKDHLIAQKQQGLEMYAETITEQARDLQFYQQARVHDADDEEIERLRARKK